MDKQAIIDHLNKQAFYSREVPSIKWNWKAEGLGLCPFHEDHDLSFSANRENGLFYCQGCGESGSVIDFFIMQHGGDFRGDLKALAREAGVDTSGQEPDAKKVKTPRKIVKTFDYIDESGRDCIRRYDMSLKTFDKEGRKVTADGPCGAAGGKLLCPQLTLQ